MSDPEESEPTSQQTQPPAPKFDAYVVRYGTMRKVGEFTARARDSYVRGDEVVVRSNRGVEWGEILCAGTKRTREYLKQSDNPGRILREVSDEDRRSRDEVMTKETEHFEVGSAMITERSLQMQLVDVEQIFGGERLIFYYLAEQRVDFRELVKDLARHFKTRIEMRHIGVRDEAKLLADYGDCGKPVCCNTHLQEMPPVSMKMAKLQKATLDPNKISGRCGRLKCCLRYEYDTYTEYRRELPSMGSTVVTKEGQGRVIGQEVLARKVVLSMEGGRRAIVGSGEILTVVSKASGSKAGKKDDTDKSNSAASEAPKVDGKDENSG
ncbi:MAG: stage 0 sporulation family protein [Planctomycetaceae bacterium]